MKKQFLFSAFAFASVALAFAAPNPKPFVIPELRDWAGQEGNWAFQDQTAIVVQGDNKHLASVARIFAKDIKTMFGKDIAVKTGIPAKGDIVLTLWKLNQNNPEAYSLEIGDIAKITANTPQGAFWATRTILQILEQSDNMQMPKGQTLDYPKYPVRGFMLDVARKFFRIEFLRDYVQFMAYYKMNTFHIHLNDNGFKQFFENDWMKTYSAFRLECDTYPGLTAKDGFYTKKEFIALQKLAERNYVTIIPEIDIPAHSLAFSQYKPEIGSKEYGMDHLDLFNPETYQFVDGLFKEYLSGPEPVFLGERVHVGTDEYSNAKKEVVEKFRYFTDHCIREVEKYGKKAAVWGALTHAKGDTPVKSKDVLMYAWHNPYGQPKDMVQQGYDLISIPDGLLYLVPEAGYYYNYLNTKHLYNNWEPKMIGNVTFEDGDPKIRGGMFAVWNDHVGNGISEKDVHHRVFPAMQTLSVKMWNGNNPNLVPFDQFDKMRKTISEAPGVNIMGNVKADANGIVLQKEKLLPGAKTGLTEIGYADGKYKVEFTLNIQNPQKGTVLFRSPNATVYLADPENGKLAFKRDGYLYSFNYTVPFGRPVRLAIEGDARSTKLYVDGNLRVTLDTIRVPRSKDGKATIACVRTLVFPLEEVGRFKGEISNLVVTKN